MPSIMQEIWILSHLPSKFRVILAKERDCCQKSLDFGEEIFAKTLRIAILIVYQDRTGIKTTD